MKKSFLNISHLVDLFEYKVAQYTQLTPEQEKNPSSDQIKNRSIQADLELSLPQVKQSVMEFLALKDPNDMKLVGQFAPQSNVLLLKVSFPNRLRQFINSKVVENKKSHPAFSLPTFIQQEVSRQNKNIPARVDSIDFV